MIDFWAKLPPDQRTRQGRPTVLDAKELEKLWQMRRKGVLLTECASHFGVHVATICRYITIVRKRKLEKMRADRLGTRESHGL